MARRRTWLQCHHILFLALRPRLHNVLATLLLCFGCLSTQNLRFPKTEQYQNGIQSVKALKRPPLQYCVDGKKAPTRTPACSRRVMTRCAEFTPATQDGRGDDQRPWQTTSPLLLSAALTRRKS